MVRKICFTLVLTTVSLLGAQRISAECIENTSGSCKCQTTYDANGNFVSSQCASDALTVPSAGTHCTCPPKDFE